MKKALKILIALVIGFSSVNVSFAGESGEEEAFDPGSMIMHHIADAHDWHLFGHVHVPLPIILYDQGLQVFLSSNFEDADVSDKIPAGADVHVHAKQYGDYIMIHEHIYKALTVEIDEAGHVHGEAVLDFSITKNVASMFISVAFLFFVFFTMASFYKKNKGKAPKGLTSFFEPIICYIRDDIAIPTIGEKKYKKYMPYLLTIFFFIWFNNLLGLLPTGANLTGNIAVTLVLSVITFIITNVSGNKNYWGHVFKTPGVPTPLLVIMIPVEIIGLFTKPFSLMVRLFANITAGHIIILSLLSLVFIMQSIAVAPISVAFSVFMNFLELFVALLQAYVFTLLSSMYIGSAVEEHH